MREESIPRDGIVRVRRVRAPGGTRGSSPVVLLHGFTGSADAWGEAIPRGLDRTVLLVDLPGHGGGARARQLVGLDFEGAVDAVVEAVARSLMEDGDDGEGEEDGGPPPDWIGYSMGGRIALAVAVRHPRRVRRLVLESASPGLPDAAGRASRRRRDEARARRLETGELAAFVDAWMAQPLFRSQAVLPDEVKDEARRVRLSQDPAALAAALRVMGTGAQPSFREVLGEVDIPTLLLTGALDRKFCELAGEMLRHLPQARHHSVEGVGHAVHLEAPGRWLQAVRPFLEHSAPPPS